MDIDHDWCHSLYFVDPNGTAFSLIGPENLAVALRGENHASGYAHGLEDGLVFDHRRERLCPQDYQAGQHADEADRDVEEPFRRQRPDCDPDK